MDEDGVRRPGPAVRYGEIKAINTKDMVKAGVAAGNIFVQSAQAETMELPQASSEQLHKQRELVEQMELQRRMRALVVPTDDASVRALLRQLEEPMTLFGEREMERRERLRRLLATMDEDRLAAIVPPEVAMEEAQPAPQELFYTEGSEELRQARIEVQEQLNDVAVLLPVVELEMYGVFGERGYQAASGTRRGCSLPLVLAHFSLRRAAERLAAAKRRRSDPDEDEAATLAHTEAALKTLINQSSEIGDERPIVGCAFAPDGAHLATGSWSGALKVWTSPDCQKQLTIKAHTERITGIAWQPQASFAGRMDDDGAGPCCLATGATDNTAKLWSAEGKLLRTLSGHSDRLGRIAFHPAGRHLGTASYDLTWRLWDCETGHCLLEQEGHSRSVYTVAFQCDGSLAISGGMDAVGRVWDLRTGRNILTLEGHVKAVLAADWSPNGFLVATGGEDNTARIFDLRKRGTLHVLPGHTSLVSQVRFEPVDGLYLLTSGFDNVSKVWSGRKFQLVKTLAGHEGKVMGSDISPDGSYLIASTGYDRTIKLFSPDPLAAAAADEAER
ncbi:hypothetical protein N2152v2_009504 [Parachlorella kessleri]